MMKTFIVSAVVSGIIAFTVAFLSSATANKNVFDANQDNGVKSVLPVRTPLKTVKPLVISKEEVSSLSIETSYRDFIGEQDSNCLEKNSSRNDSPCQVEIVFDRDGNARKTISRKTYDAKSKTSSYEETKWKGKSNATQFDDLAAFIVESEMFKNWDESVDLYASNCAISVKYSKGERRMLSNVDKTAKAYLPKVEAFMKLDRTLNWEKIQ